MTGAGALACLAAGAGLGAGEGLGSGAGPRLGAGEWTCGNADDGTRTPGWKRGLGKNCEPDGGAEAARS